MWWTKLAVERARRRAAEAAADRAKDDEAVQRAAAEDDPDRAREILDRAARRTDRRRP
jgi:ATP/maltotriose-dependent transcriptional regulator MalT